MAVIEKRLFNFKDLPGKSLLNTEEVAKFLGFSSKTIRRMYEEGELEGVRVRKRDLRIFRESVISHLRKQYRIEYTK